MAEYISDITGAHLYGLDYSSEAISQAVSRTVEKCNRLTFVEGLIGEKVFDDNTFDLIISVDTIFFGRNMTKTIKSLINSLKLDGRLAIIFAQMLSKDDKSIDKLKPDNTELAAALKECRLDYKTYDFTRQHFKHMQLKNKTAKSLEPEFIKENHQFIYDNITCESINSSVEYRDFTKSQSRYLYYVQL